MRITTVYDYRNRVYSVELGRFLQTDPIRFEAGDGNLYRYVGNQTSIFTDPLGTVVEQYQRTSSLFRILARLIKQESELTKALWENQRKIRHLMNVLRTCLASCEDLCEEQKAYCIRRCKEDTDPKIDRFVVKSQNIHSKLAKVITKVERVLIELHKRGEVEDYDVTKHLTPLDKIK